MAARWVRGRGKKRGRRDPETLAALLMRAAPDDGSQKATPVPPRVWQDAVGDRIAARTRPLRLERRVLTVRAATSVWAQELTFLAEAIVARLVALGFEVESLRFQVGPIEPPSRQPRLANVKTVPAVHDLPRELSARLEGVEDAELRATLQRAAASNLAWQSALEPPVRTERRTPVSAARRAAPDLRYAAREIAPPAPASPTVRAARRDKP
jgi:hypothetical protein